MKDDENNVKKQEALKHNETSTFGQRIRSKKKMYGDIG